MTRINPSENITTNLLYSQFDNINKKLSRVKGSDLNEEFKKDLENRVEQLVIDMNAFASKEQAPRLTEDELVVFGMEITDLHSHLIDLDINLERQIKSLIDANKELIAHSEVVKEVAQESFQQKLPQEQLVANRVNQAPRAERTQKLVEQQVTPEAKNRRKFDQLQSEFRALIYDSERYPLQKAKDLEGLQKSLLLLQNEKDLSPKLNSEIIKLLGSVQSELDASRPKSLLGLLKQVKENNNDYERVNREIDSFLLVKEIAAKETELGELRLELETTSPMRIGARNKLKKRIREGESVLAKYRHIAHSNESEINNLKQVRLLLKPLILENNLKLLQSYTSKPITGIEGEVNKDSQMFFILREALKTEKSFNDDLKIGLGIAKELQKQGLLTPEQENLISKMEEALRFSDEMLVKLNDAGQRDKDGNLLSVDLKKFAQIFDLATLIEIYTTFAFMSEVQAMGEQIKELSDKQLENDDFRVFNIVQEIGKNDARLFTGAQGGANAGEVRTEMTKYTIVMTQRLPRLELLLKEIMKELKGEEAKTFNEQIVQPFIAVTQALNSLNGR